MTQLKIILFTFESYNYACSGSENIGQNGRMISQYELERMQKKETLSNFRYCDGICLEELRKATKPLERTVHLPTDYEVGIACIRSRNAPY